MRSKQLRLMTLTALVLSASIIMAGCNRGGNANAGAADEAAEDPAGNNAESDGTDTASADPGNNSINVSGTANERPLNIIRDSTPPEPEFYFSEGPDVQPTPTPFPDSEDPYEPAPQFFDVEDSVEPVMGYCDNDMRDALIAALNVNRTNFDVGNVTKNYSLSVAAEVRAKEYAIYPVYKKRPDDRPFTSVSPQGFVENEYFCIPVRNSVIPAWDPQRGYWLSQNYSHPKDSYSPTVIVEGLMEIREARNIMMNPDYRQVGAVWFVNGDYVIAGFTFSY